ncbi:MAG: protein kinase domain-containing protein [Stenotrophobium sp.]
MLWKPASKKPAASGDFPSRPPQKIGKYEVREEIGRGTCGVVYRGFDPFVQREVALKVALQPSGSSPQKSEHERAFFAEARAAGRLSHPHIVSLYDAGAENELSYLVMEHVDGHTLVPLCARNAPRAPLEQVIDISFKCARALDYAHSKGVMHRDIKPGNIMLTRDGVTKLMDFSIATVDAQQAPAQYQTPVGSPRYMSPEQSQCKPLSPASDLYALGAVMYHLLTGEPPFTVNDPKQLFEDVTTRIAPRVDLLRPDLPAPMTDIIARLLLKNPAERCRSGRELAAELTRLFNKLRISGQQIARRESRDSLRALRFFNGFSDEDIDEILKASVLGSYASGASIIAEGDIDHAFYIIVDGSAEVCKNGKSLSLLGKGDCVGEIGFLGATRRTASVVAVAPVQALKVNAALMDQVSMECQLRFYKVFTETLITRLSATNAKLTASAAAAS